MWNPLILKSVSKYVSYVSLKNIYLIYVFKEHLPNLDMMLISRVLQEYCEKMREMGVQLLRGISKSLGLAEDYIEKKMNLESGYNAFGPNYYPALSHSSDEKNQIGQFPHRDPGLLVLLAQDVDGGLQIEHQKKWFNANFPPSSIFVIVADHIEVHLNSSPRIKAI